MTNMHSRHWDTHVHWTIEWTIDVPFYDSLTDSLFLCGERKKRHRRNLSISKYVTKNIAHVVDHKSVSRVSTLVLYMVRKWPPRAQSLVIQWKANQKSIMWGTGALKVSLSKLSRHHRLSQQHQFPYLGNVILCSPVSSLHSAICNDA